MSLARRARLPAGVHADARRIPEVGDADGDVDVPAVTREECSEERDEHGGSFAVAKPAEGIRRGNDSERHMIEPRRRCGAGSPTAARARSHREERDEPIDPRLELRRGE
jgi:hypothetical protein